MKNEFIEIREKLFKDEQEAIKKFGIDVMEKLFDMAWDRGHSEGESMIKQELRDLIQVLHLLDN